MKSHFLMRFLFLFLFITNRLTSQVTRLNDDTLYVYFDKEARYNNLNLSTSANKAITVYLYQFPDAKGLQFNVYKKEKTRVTKSKKKIEHKLISLDSIQKNGFVKMFGVVYGKKVIFIVERKNRRKFFISRAYLQNMIEVKI